MDKVKIKIRALKPKEIPYLEDMLFQAIYIPEGGQQLEKEIIFHPTLHHYIKDFGRKKDFALVAEKDGKLVGAIWIRIFSEEQKGYGFVDAGTPELSMAIDSNFRNQGIGGQMLAKMLTKMNNLGHKQVSLSVDTRNFAFAMYQKFAFQVHEMSGNTAVMLKVF
jgi:ribosomal protein S18 acetylase RimI-like enzyme